METKKEIRAEMLKQRRQYSKERNHAFSKIIAEKVIAHPYFVQAEQIYCYVDFDGEVRTRQIIKAALALGKQAWVPKVHGETMEFYQIHSLEELSAGSFGILEPSVTNGCSKNDNNSGKLMIMPGVAFDTFRNRIGYGKGCYDRYLKKYKGFHTIALAFEYQIVDEIPAEATDIRPEFVMTERRILYTFERK